jgi:hypothetical protein
MEIPRVGRPHMPGYGIAPATEGSGLLPWSWAAERLTMSRNYWVSSVWPDGRPHSMPVWGMWDDAVLWFSSSIGSRKTRNLAANPQCCVTTEDAADPVVLEGTAGKSQGHPQDRGGGGVRGAPGGFHGQLDHVAGVQAGRDHR